MSEQEMITITKEEYDSLIESSMFLYALKAVGVDNWEGYEIAKEEFCNTYST